MSNENLKFDKINLGTMTEAFLQYIWKYKLYNEKNLSPVNGENIHVQSPGILNTDAGPDFFDSRIVIDNTLWAGNVEIHINASDWNTHGHQKDKAYDNVILHAVVNNDTPIKLANGRLLTTVVLDFPEELLENYQSLLDSEAWIPCQEKFRLIDSFTIKFWLGKLAVERLERKTEGTETLLARNKNSWEETFYQQLARSFGFGVNAEPFEQLAKSLEQSILAKNKGNQEYIEALLFGQAGFLEENKTKPDAYYAQLKKDYQFLKLKYGLRPIEKHIWKFMRLRPVNFPTIRIAQFAALVNRSQHLFSKILETEDISLLEDLFRVEPSKYWTTHYNFKQESKVKTKKLGTTAFESIVINTVVPILFAYGKYKGEEKYRSRALNFWEEINAEKNTIIREWKALGATAQNAADSQALLELKKAYCEAKRCLVCPIGNKIVNSNG